ncbi:hypothetical protein BH11CYA1_BH11CYA1_22810 [soil metagenome]
MKIDSLVSVQQGRFLFSSALAFASLLVFSGAAQAQTLAQAPSADPSNPPNGAYPVQMSQPPYGQSISQPVAQPYGTERTSVAPNAPLPVPSGMLVTTTMNVDGYRIREYKGLVRGAMVREPTIGQNFKAGFQGMFGGKIGAYITMCEQGRQQSYDSMVAKAQALGANAVVGVQYDSNSFSADSNQFATEVVCYGTAVYIEPIR